MPLSQSGLYQFSVAFAVLVYVTDVTGFVGLSQYAVQIKYLYAGATLSFIAYYYVRWGTIDGSSLAPILAFVFFVVTGITFAVNVFIYDIPVSYVTAFTASLVFAAAAFIPQGRFVVDSDRITRRLCLLFTVGSAFYLVEAVLKAGNLGAALMYSPIIEHVKSIVCVLGLCLGILSRQRAMVILLSLITVAALVVRPSSTLVIALLVCAPIAFSLREESIGFARASAYTVLAGAIITPWLFYWFFDAIADAVTGIETYIKEDFLGGRSNTDFRLAIIKLALRGLDESIIYGQGLSGNPNVPLGREFPWWFEVVPDGSALIHSDWIVVLSQAGVLGYTLFALFLCSLLRRRFRLLASSTTGESTRVLHSLSIIAAVAFVIYSSFNPLLPLYHCVQQVWLILFVSEMASKERVSGLLDFERKRVDRSAQPLSAHFIT